MPRTRTHREAHKTQQIGWLRASVLGANDGIVSTASLLLGVAASNAEPRTVMMTGVAGLVAGAMSMAAGEYVSVSSQADTERADVEREKGELATQPEAEFRELAGLYVKRGLTPELASQVAQQLTKHDALDAHLRDELGLSEVHAARPVQAALTSAASFAVGALVPLLVAVLAPRSWIVIAIAVASLSCLAAAGAFAAKTGGARVGVAVGRVTFWGALAMAFTWGIGALFGVAVG